MTILVTGAAGFIGYHLCSKLIENKEEVIGFDNLNNYYDVILKERVNRLNKKALVSKSKFYFLKGDLSDKNDLKKIFNNNFDQNSKNNIKSIKYVVHLAAQAGVRYSIDNPSAYVQSNLLGFCNLIEECKINKISHFIYASSSSVYGGNRDLPFKESDNVDHPISLYAATKKSNELIAHTYSHLFNLSNWIEILYYLWSLGQTRYGFIRFTDLIMKNKPINVFNFGNMIRDFTYIDDLIQAVILLIKKLPKGKK